MIGKTYETPKGTIHYWISKAEDSKADLVFLPGLTADHRLFEKQTAAFEGKYTVFVWDAPGHAASRPFEMTFSLPDKTRWLDEILQQEGIFEPVIVGQSMGGYVGQVYAELFPEKLKGFISIDSAPLQKSYVTGIERWMLKHTELMYRYYPWKTLLRQGSKGAATTDYGQATMLSFMLTYKGNQKEYAKLAGHGFRILAEAMEADLPYEIPCPALLICGTKDHAGSAKHYNKVWHKKTGLPIAWIEGAGHNANTDAPEEVNGLIRDFLDRL